MLVTQQPRLWLSPLFNGVLGLGSKVWSRWNPPFERPRAVTPRSLRSFYRSGGGWSIIKPPPPHTQNGPLAMIVWSILTIPAWAELQQRGHLRASRLCVEQDFMAAYEWMTDQMERRLATPRPSKEAMPISGLDDLGLAWRVEEFRLTSRPYRIANPSSCRFGQCFGKGV